MFIDYGVDPNIRDYLDHTPLNAASQHGHIAVVRTILAQPTIKVNAYSKDQMISINIAAQNGHAEFVKMLLSSGAHAGFVREGAQAPLHSHPE